MQAHNIIGIVRAACDLSQTTEEALRSIARATASVISRGPIGVAELDSGAPFGCTRVWFERADERFVSSVAVWLRETPADLHRLARSLGPRAVQFHTEQHAPLPATRQALAHPALPLWLLANTGDGGGLHIVFGNLELAEWRPERLTSLHQLAAHLAMAWRLRKALDAGGAGPPSCTTGDVLRRAVLAGDRVAARRSCVPAPWSALLAGRWSVVDTFTDDGTRYIVAHENPAGCEALRALSARERSVLELVLAGRSGKWIACETQLSESIVTRTLRLALHKIGVTDAAALSGVPAARFEPLDGLGPGVNLAVARLVPRALAPANLSDAERAIVDSLLDGKHIARIARERGTSPRTVEHQITSAYHKLGVSSRRELFALLTPTGGASQEPPGDPQEPPIRSQELPMASKPAARY